MWSTLPKATRLDSEIRSQPSQSDFRAWCSSPLCCNGFYVKIEAAKSINVQDRLEKHLNALTIITWKPTAICYCQWRFSLSECETCQIKFPERQGPQHSGSICFSTRLLRPWDFPGQNTGVGCHFLLQGIFPTHGWNLGLPHCRQTLYPLSHQGSCWMHKLSTNFYSHNL